MGLFSKKVHVPTCVMCGRAEGDGCGSAHRHVVEVRGDEPTWLPASYRSQAQGEFTWYCTRCNSFPALKWPHTGGAHAGMMVHLGAAHRVGDLAGMSGQRIEMIPLR